MIVDLKSRMIRRLTSSSFGPTRFVWLQETVEQEGELGCGNRKTPSRERTHAC